MYWFKFWGPAHTKRLNEYISACFTGLWIQSFEHDDAIAEIAQMCRDENWRLCVWDVARGLQLPGQANSQPTDAGGTDPLAAIRSINALGSKDSSAILVLLNFHRFLQSAEIVQALSNQISQGKANRTFIVVLSPVVQIPPELEKLFCVVEHALPDRAQLEQIARQTAVEPGELNEEQLPRILDAAAGMTRFEAEAAYSLCLVAQQAIDEELTRQQQAGTVESNGHTSASGNGHHNGNGNGNGHAAPRRSGGRRATASQARALRAIAERQGIDLTAELQNRFGVNEPEELSITEASQTIDELKASANGSTNGRR